MNVTNERKMVNEAISAIPKKVQDALNNGTIIDIGKGGASQYDYIHDILYVAKGADREAVIHEIGHMVENKMLDAKKVEKLKERFLIDVPLDNIIQKIYDDKWNIKSDILQEFISEPFREYIENPERLKKEFPELYKLIKEAVE